MPKVQRYVSEELAHFVGRGRELDAQYSLLVHILRTGWLTHPPHNPNFSGNLSINLDAKLSTNVMYSPGVVCFCDIPIEDLHIHTSKYSRFGLCLLKDFVARQGGAPVLYLPQDGRLCAPRSLPRDQLIEASSKDGLDDMYEDISMGKMFDRMVPEYHALMDHFRKLIMQAKQKPGVPDEHRRLHELLQFLDFRLFSYVKFFDHQLTDDDPNNFYMEREWRVIGNVHFNIGDVTRVFIPKEYASQLRVDLPEFIGQVNFVE